MSLSLGRSMVDLPRLDDYTVNIRRVVNRHEFIEHIGQNFVSRAFHRVTKPTGTRLDVQEFITLRVKMRNNFFSFLPKFL